MSLLTALRALRGRHRHDADVRYADSAELAATIAEEGGTYRPTSSSPRTRALSALRDQLPRPCRGGARPGRRAVPRQRRALAAPGRARDSSTDELTADEVPDSVRLTDPNWNGTSKFADEPHSRPSSPRCGSMPARSARGRARRRMDDPKLYGEHAGRRGCPWGDRVSVNHYYPYLVKQECPERADRDRPSATIRRSSASPAGRERSAGGERFVESLLADEQQRFYTEDGGGEQILWWTGSSRMRGAESPSLRAQPCRRSPRLARAERTLELLNETGSLVILVRAGRGGRPSLLLPACSRSRSSCRLSGRPRLGRRRRGWRADAVEHARAGSEHRFFVVVTIASSRSATDGVAGDAHRPARPGRGGGRQPPGARSRCRRLLLLGAQPQGAAAAATRGRAAA